MSDHKLSLATFQLFKFVVVGLISTALNYLVFLILFQNTSTSYTLSSALGFIMGALFGYLLNKTWTYQSSESSSRVLPLYAILYTTSLFTGLLFLKALVIWIGIIPEIANILTIGLTTVINFLGTKFWVFRNREQ